MTEAGTGYVLIRGDEGWSFCAQRRLDLVELDDSGKTNFKFNKTGDSYVLEAVTFRKVDAALGKRRGLGIAVLRCRATGIPYMSLLRLLLAHLRSSFAALQCPRIADTAR